MYAFRFVLIFCCVILGAVFSSLLLVVYVINYSIYCIYTGECVGDKLVTFILSYSPYTGPIQPTLDL